MIGCTHMNFLLKAFESYHLTDRELDKQTRPKLCTMPLHGWSIICLDKTVMLQYIYPVDKIMCITRLHLSFIYSGFISYSVSVDTDTKNTEKVF